MMRFGLLILRQCHICGKAPHKRFVILENVQNIQVILVASCRSKCNGSRGRFNVVWLCSCAACAAAGSLSWKASVSQKVVKSRSEFPNTGGSSARSDPHPTRVTQSKPARERRYQGAGECLCLLGGEERSWSGGMVACQTVRLSSPNRQEIGAACAGGVVHSRCRNRQQYVVSLQRGAAFELATEFMLQLLSVRCHGLVAQPELNGAMAVRPRLVPQCFRLPHIVARIWAAQLPGFGPIRSGHIFGLLSDFRRCKKPQQKPTGPNFTSCANVGFEC
eukprot:SAG11_NODE_948_length_6409_cov_7.859113_3_plen_276_part_00